MAVHFGYFPASRPLCYRSGLDLPRLVDTNRGTPDRRGSGLDCGATVVPPFARKAPWSFEFDDASGAGESCNRDAPVQSAAS